MDEKRKIADDEVHLTDAETSEEITSSAEETDVTLAAPEQNTEAAEILRLRGENRKVFKMKDGIEQAVFYPSCVHMYDSDTETFEEVDNTLTEEEDGRHFRNTKNRFVARFSREEYNDELFSIEQEDRAITVSVKKNSSQTNKGAIPVLRKAKVSHGKVPGDKLIYGDVLSGTDIEYSATVNGVKENIIIKERRDVYYYPFVLELRNVVANFIEAEKRIVFSDSESGNDVFCIPAPFMTDAAGVSSAAVSYEVRQITEDKLVLTVSADSEWINSENRVFPVTIDPQINISGSNGMTTHGWNGGTVYAAPSHTVGTTENSDGTYTANRMYITIASPALPRNPRIKKAELKVYQASSVNTNLSTFKIGLYKVTDSIVSGSSAPTHDTTLIDFVRTSADAESYSFDISTLYDSMMASEASEINLVLKMIDETTTSANNLTLCGSSDTSNPPEFCITYESGCEMNSTYRSHSQTLGRFGRAKIDLQRGNLMFSSEDFSWKGNRMPVTIRHMYNSILGDCQYTRSNSIGLKTADFSAMKVGYGWKLNLMQSIIYDGELDNYIYTDENGSEIYFKLSDNQCCDIIDTDACYNLYEDVDLSGIYYDPCKRELYFGNQTYTFDTAGRLIGITDSYGNHMDITYTSGKITSVTDGVGRAFTFDYNTSGELKHIIAPDGSAIEYTYTDNMLSGITYPDGKLVEIRTVYNVPTAVILKDADNTPLYKVMYEYSGERVSETTEYGAENGVYITGTVTAFDYSIASHRTVVQKTEPMDTEEGETEDKVTRTVYTFDQDGNVVSQYTDRDDLGHRSESGHAVDNLLCNHNFMLYDNWTSAENNSENTGIEISQTAGRAKFGRRFMEIKATDTASIENGLYQNTISLPEGKYAFSAYLRLLSNFEGETNPGAYIRVTSATGTVLAESERLTEKNSEYVRLIAPFEITAAMSVKVYVLLDGAGSVYVSAAQLENNSFAGPYNMLINGGFEHGETGWESTENASVSAETSFTMNNSLAITGDLDSRRTVSQTVLTKAGYSVRETFTLSGWAKGCGLPIHDGETDAPQFRLRATLHYTDTDIDDVDYYADFTPNTTEWQFASVQFAKEKYGTIGGVTVACEYNYNSGTVFFDDIQLKRTSLETDLTRDDFPGEDVDDSSDAELYEEETEDEVPAFEESVDEYGNTLTGTTFADGEFGTIYSSYGFTPDSDGAENAGNDRIYTTDARGNKTTYTVDEETSRNSEITDRLGNKTAYEYDESGRITKVTSKKSDDTEIANVSYAYDTFDNLTEITRGDGMKYSIAYNAFHNLESIGVAGMNDPLVTYAYKNGNGKLKSVTYANGHTMKVVYNSLGKIISEKWYESCNAPDPIAYYKYIYDSQGNIVKTIDIAQNKEYTYTYEEGRIVRATECDITLDCDIITAKSVSNAIHYVYNSDGRLVKKSIVPADGEARVYHYEYSDSGTVVKFTAGGKTVTSHSKSDSFGRRVFDELQLESGFVSRQFSYHAGKVTDEHEAGEKLKSSPTTNLVSQIVLSDGHTLSYGYDMEERITSVTDTYTDPLTDEAVVSVTQYTYDEIGQLLTETVDGEVVSTMTYDNYGNILTKNGKAYTYGDSVWKDRLTAYNGQSITYDAQGNPTSYLGHTLAWEKGRQLKSFDSNTYTYNASGIRTSKTINGVKHTYELDGTKILRETWTGNTLIPLYDNANSVCGIIHNRTPFYFLKNLQGDVIAITNKNGDVIARYSYDAWGVCTIEPGTTNVVVADLNPFRYRGYYYDDEIGMYYLQSRYYDPNTGRFVNGDVIDLILIHKTSVNMYVYCKNNPKNSIDIRGFFGMEDIYDFLDGILSSISDACDFILEEFNISDRQYKKLRYHSIQDLYGFVRDNSSSFKKIGKNVSNIANFIKIIYIVYDNVTFEHSCDVDNDKKSVLAIAGILFDGLLELIEFIIGSLISWFVNTVLGALSFLLRVLIDYIISYFVDLFGELVFKPDTLKEEYLKNVDIYKMNFVGLTTAFLKGLVAVV